MALKIADGKYVLTDRGDPVSVRGDDEVLERVLFKLKVRRNSFLPMPNLGSRLYLLPKEKKANIENAARQYITEALAEETDISVADVTAEYKKEGIWLHLMISYGGNDRELSLLV